MKKTIALFSTVFLSSSLIHAEALQCQQSYDIFNQNVARSQRFLKTGDVDAYLKFYQEISYSHLFQSIHPGKVFVNDQWIDEQEDKEQTKRIFDFFVQQPKDYQIMQLKYNKTPKANFMTEVGEVCVIATQEMFRYAGETFKSRYDTVFVRNTLDNQWRDYAYNGSESAEDLNMFFPDFLQQMRLSAVKVNGLNLAEYRKHLDLIYLQQENILMTDTILEAIHREYLETKQRLKANGH